MFAPLWQFITRNHRSVHCLIPKSVSSCSPTGQFFENHFSSFQTDRQEGVYRNQAILDGKTNRQNNIDGKCVKKLVPEKSLMRQRGALSLRNDVHKNMNHAVWGNYRPFCLMFIRVIIECFLYKEPSGKPH